MALAIAKNIRVRTSVLQAQISRQRHRQQYPQQQSIVQLGMATYSSTASSRPPWLKALLDDNRPAPKLYAWTPSNLNTHSGGTNSSSSSPRPYGDDLDRRIFILGVGNLGRLYASYLSRHEHQAPSQPPPITLVVHRKELLSQWMESDGIEITRLGVLKKAKNFDIEWWTETPPEHGEVREVAGGSKLHSLIIATKSSSAMPEADRMRGYLDSGSTVVFLQNGMSKLWPPHGQTYLAHRYPDGNWPSILAGVNNHGVISQGPFKSLHASPADTAIGPVLVNQRGVLNCAEESTSTSNKADTNTSTSSVSHLTNTIAGATLLNAKAVSSADLWVLQLQKLVVNSTINPLTAVLRCKNGKLFENEDGPIGQVIDKLLAESSAVLQALIEHPSSTEILAVGSGSGGSTCDSDETPGAAGIHRLDHLRQQLNTRFSHPELRSMLYRLGQVVKDNTSSMLQDVRAGKQTEIRDFNGWLVDTASFLSHGLPNGLEVPNHKALIDLVENGAIMDEVQLGKAFHTGKVIHIPMI